MSWLFGDDDSVQKAFELNLANIAAGVNALTQAGVDAMPILQGMENLINTRFATMSTELSRSFASARQDIYSQMPAIGYATEAAMATGFGDESAAAMSSGAYGTTVQQGRRSNIARQGAMDSAMARAGVAGQAAQLTAQEALTRYSGGAAATEMITGVRGQEVGLLESLALGQANLRSGITFVGERNPGFLESVVAPITGMALGMGWKPWV